MPVSQQTSMKAAARRRGPARLHEAWDEVPGVSLVLVSVPSRLALGSLSRYGLQLSEIFPLGLIGRRSSPRQGMPLVDVGSSLSMVQSCG